MGKCSCWTTSDGLSVCAITTMEYPEKAPFILINNMLLDFRETFAADPSVYENVVVDQKDGAFPYPAINEYFVKWQQPQEADKLMKIEKELSDVKEIMQQNMSDIMKRGENLD